MEHWKIKVSNIGPYLRKRSSATVGVQNVLLVHGHTTVGVDAFSWLNASLSTNSTFSTVRVVRFLPLPGFARDSPGMERNVQRPGQVHSGQMSRRPGMNYSGAKFSDFTVIFFKNRKVKMYLQQNKVLQTKKFQSRQFVDYVEHSS